MARELHFPCWKDVGLHAKSPQHTCKGTRRVFGKSFSKDSDPGAAVISPRSVYGIDDAIIRPLRSNSNRVWGELVCELVVAKDLETRSEALRVGIVRPGYRKMTRHIG
jgi:hypothetical protein